MTPNADGWRALAEAEYGRARGGATGRVVEAAAVWERLERPPIAAYCRWRQAEALAGASADATARWSGPRGGGADGARPLLRELELLADRAQLELVHG